MRRSAQQRFAHRFPLGNIAAYSFKSTVVKRFFLLLRSARHERGQSLVEMAMILPFLVVMILGTVEFGYYIYVYSELENATRRASEFASKTPPLATSGGGQCAQLAKNDALSNVFLSNKTAVNMSITLYPTVSSSVREVGKQVQVTTTYSGTFLTPVAQRWFGNTLSFNFVARRTITSVDPPPGLNANCL